VPTFTVSGVVSDGSRAYGSVPNSGLNAGTVRALDEANAGSVATVFTGGSYRLTVKTGVVMLSASAEGYRSLEKTVSIDRDTRVDFALPRTSISPVPAISGTWAGRIAWKSNVSAAEFTFVQNGTAVSGTWRAPNPGYEGTLSGTMDGERSLVGHMTLTRPCASSAAIRYGLLAYSERAWTLGVTFAGSCAPDDLTFEIDRR
jgi:hypothetical protein